MAEFKTFVEIGKKRVFAGAVDWPGWCRKGRDERSALQALLESGPRYQALLSGTGLTFQAPEDPGQLLVIERVPGSSTTDYGAPDAPLETDSQPVSNPELKRWLTLLSAYWKAFDSAVHRARGKQLSKGPRGGGRDLQGILSHLAGADGAYLKRLAWKYRIDQDGNPAAVLEQIRPQMRMALENACSGNLPASGPRGGKIWTPRFYMRRASWHTLDHAWEIEDRTPEN
jgi:hypothetical protein